jgi:hypothetical protein
MSTNIKSYLVQFESDESAYIVDCQTPVRIRGKREKDIAYSIIGNISDFYFKEVEYSVYYDNTWIKIISLNKLNKDVNYKFIVNITGTDFPSDFSFTSEDLRKIIEDNMPCLHSSLTIAVEPFGG